MKSLHLSFLILLLAGVLHGAYAQKSEINSQNGKAISGYDPVGYFKLEKPVLGKAEFKASYGGAEWYFSSKENMDLFLKSPNDYLPQYGGYCAFGVAGGYKAKISPEAWSIVNGKLYLNYNKSVQADWLKERDTMIQKADKNWTEVKKK